MVAEEVVEVVELPGRQGPPTQLFAAQCRIFVSHQPLREKKKRENLMGG